MYRVLPNVDSLLQNLLHEIVSCAMMMPTEMKIRYSVSL